LGSPAFEASWLELREPADHRARRAELVEPLDAWLLASGRSRVLDLGAGTGSNLRYLAPRLSASTRWTLLDQDPLLLARAPRSGVRHLIGDLGGLGVEAVADADLVTASALLDLVSADWLARVVDAMRAAGSAGLFALTWDGAVRWLSRGVDAPDRDDGLVIGAVRSHQRRDKGLGPALGPTAGEVTERSLAAAGYRTRVLPSPWRLGPADAALALALVGGWEEAALEQRPSDAGRIRAWGERRRATVRADFELLVGHDDLLALPPEAP
jgi:SAM-dependent methyltransferase